MFQRHAAFYVFELGPMSFSILKFVLAARGQEEDVYPRCCVLSYAQPKLRSVSSLSEAGQGEVAEVFDLDI